MSSQSAQARPLSEIQRRSARRAEYLFRSCQSQLAIALFYPQATSAAASPDSCPTVFHAMSMPTFKGETNQHPAVPTPDAAA